MTKVQSELIEICSNYIEVGSDAFEVADLSSLVVKAHAIGFYKWLSSFSISKNSDLLTDSSYIVLFDLYLSYIETVK